MRPVVIFDIDGTIANIDHRRLHLMKDTPDWKSFHDGIGDDIPNKPIVELYKTLWESEKYEIIITSGRFESARKLTQAWFIWNQIPFSKIFMRADGDMRIDAVVKSEFLEEISRSGKTILFAVDDRQQVVDMWRRNGVTCLQCAVGDF